MSTRDGEKRGSSAWLEAQRAMSERNAATRKAGRDARAKQEQRMAAERAARERGRVYR